MAGRQGKQEQDRGEARALDVVYRSPLPGNRPIVRTNKDEQMEDFVGYMD